MAKLRILFATLLLFAICIYSDVFVTNVKAATEDEVITKGVYIDSVYIGGMTAKEANQAVEDYVNNLRSKKISVKVDDEIETITLGELEYNYKKNNYIEDALEIGKYGNLIKRYKELKDIEEGSLIYQLEFSIDESKLTEFVEKDLSSHNIPAINAGVSRENGRFIYTDHKTGRKLLAAETTNMIKTAIMDNWSQEDVDLVATVIDDKPLYTRDVVEKCNTLLGSYSTTYASSSADRAGNLANGAKLINNTVLYPGDVFSAYEKLTPFTKENGYYEAGAYANGMVVDSIGGGACQVTTTLYNAVLNSELEVVERAAHSMTISYAPLSRDAAIAGTWKDLKFKNNQEVPIIVEVFTKDRTITFNIWGHETRDTSNRKIKYETVILNEKAPGPDVVKEDPTKPTTYKVTTQSAHTGYTAELYKIVYENGVEVSRTRVNKSVYNPSPRYVTVGTMEVPELPDETIEEPKNEKPKNEKPKNEKPKNEKPKDDADGTATNIDVDTNEQEELVVDTSNDI